MTDAAHPDPRDGGSEQDQRVGIPGDLKPGSDLAARRDQVLVFFGHSGTSPRGSYYRYATLTAEYQKAGLTINETARWPDDVSPYRLVILSVPGQRDSRDIFTAGEVAALKLFLDAGGTLYIANDWTGFSGTEVITDLLGKLGSSLSTATSSIGGGPAMTVGTHRLITSVKTLSYSYSSRVSIGAGVSLASSGGEILIAAAPHGAGLIVIAGDGQFIDDYGLEKATGDSADNLLFVRHLAGL